MFALAGSGCIPGPSYRHPDSVDPGKATLEIGFDSGPGQVGHWVCPMLEGARGTAPRRDIVLLKDPTRGLLLHELTNDWVMSPSAQKPDGELEFVVAARDQTDHFTIRADRAKNALQEWRRGKYQKSQECQPAPAVGFL